MGNKTDLTLSLIDPERVVELETLYRTELIKKKFKNMSFAERWIHIWMSNPIKIFNQVKSCLKENSWVSQSGDRLVHLMYNLAIICNWPRHFVKQVIENKLVLLECLVGTVGRRLLRYESRSKRRS